MTLQERLRKYAESLRTNSLPLSTLIPLLQEAADEIDCLLDRVDSLEEDLRAISYAESMNADG
jgi:hypothetical protein